MAVCARSCPSCTPHGPYLDKATTLVKKCAVRTNGQVAQLVEQRTENPRVGGPIPPLTTEALGSPSGGRHAARRILATVAA